MSESTDQMVVQIIGELFEEVRKTSGPIDDSGVSFWTRHYTPLFKSAIDRKGRKYPDDKPKLLQKARSLAAAARRHAGADPISHLHAEAASKEIDCQRDPAVTDPVHADDYWCY